MDAMDNINLNVFIRGTCMDMCPVKERNLREKERLLHPSEVLDGTSRHNRPLADPEKTVKEFSRSAAGRKSLLPSDLRPLPVLERTVSFLFRKLRFDRAEDWIFEYDFIFDRIRAIHQDAVIQGINSSCCIHLYEQIARFLVYSGYRLCIESKYKYDPVINAKHLRECLKKILSLYDEESTVETKNRPTFEALYLLVNLGDPEAIRRGVGLDKNLRTKVVQVALAMSFSSWLGHYAQVLKLMKELPLLLSCAASLHIPSIRRKALMTMTIAYSSKNLSFPVKDLERLLWYSNVELLIDDCKHYNIVEQNGGFKLLKGSFDEMAELITPRPLESIDEKLSKTNIPDMLLTGKEDF